MRRHDSPEAGVVIQQGRKDVYVHHHLVVNSLHVTVDEEFTSVFKFALIVKSVSDSYVVVVGEESETVVAEPYGGDIYLVAFQLAVETSVIVVEVQAHILDILGLECYSL